MRLLLPLALASVGLAAPASATDIFGGVYAHGLNTPLSLESSREGGTDLSLGIRGRPVGRVLGMELSPYVAGQVNLDGGTDFLAGGLSTRFGRGIYFRPGLGIAVHNGSAGNFTRPDKLAFGSRILFAPEIGIGVDVSKRVAIEASWTHFSHAQLFGRQNPGIDNMGVRLNLKL